MPKLYIKSQPKTLTVKDIEDILSISRSRNFSEYDKESEDGTFDAGDNGNSEGKMYSVVDTDMAMYSLLLTLSDRHKIVFLYLLMREAGYGLTHEECAKTLSLKRETYMTVVRSVKKKASKFLKEQSL